MSKATRVAVLLVLVSCGGDAFSGSSRPAVILGNEGGPELDAVADSTSEPFDDAGQFEDAGHDARPFADAGDGADAWTHDDAQATTDAQADVMGAVDATDDAPAHDAGPLTPVCPYTTMCVQAITQAGMPWGMCDDAGQCPANDCCSAWGPQGTTSIDNQCLPRNACNF